MKLSGGDVVLWIVVVLPNVKGRSCVHNECVVEEHTSPPRCWRKLAGAIVEKMAGESRETMYALVIVRNGDARGLTCSEKSTGDAMGMVSLERLGQIISN